MLLDFEEWFPQQHGKSSVEEQKVARFFKPVRIPIVGHQSS